MGVVFEIYFLLLAFVYRAWKNYDPPERNGQGYELLIMKI